MRQSYSISASKSKERNAKGNNRRGKGACLGSPFVSDRVLVKNCIESGGTGKFDSSWKNDIYKIVHWKGGDSLVYEVQSKETQNGKKRRVLQTNMLLTCEAILEEPEAFHLKKEKQKKPKQASSHEFVNNTCDTECSKIEFQGMTLTETRRVRTRKGHSVNYSERNPTPPTQHENIQFTTWVTNNAAAARQDMNKVECRSKYTNSQDLDSSKINVETAKTWDEDLMKKQWNTPSKI